MALQKGQQQQQMPTATKSNAKANILAKDLLILASHSSVTVNLRCEPQPGLDDVHLIIPMMTSFSLFRIIAAEHDTSTAPNFLDAQNGLEGCC
jgi:hypothetical protein